MTFRKGKGKPPPARRWAVNSSASPSPRTSTQHRRAASSPPSPRHLPAPNFVLSPPKGRIRPPKAGLNGALGVSQLPGKIGLSRPAEPCSSTAPGGEGRFGWGGVNPCCKHLHPPHTKAFCSEGHAGLPQGSACSRRVRNGGDDHARVLPREGEGRALPGGCYSRQISPAMWSRAMLDVSPAHQQGGWSSLHHRAGLKGSEPGWRHGSRAGTRQRSAPSTTATGGSWETSLLWVQQPAWLRHGHSQGPPPPRAAPGEPPRLHLGGCSEIPGAASITAEVPRDGQPSPTPTLTPQQTPTET